MLVKYIANQPVAQDAMIKSYQEAPRNDDEGAALDEAGLMEGESGEEESAEDDPDNEE